ncbi:MAG: hypothetical protein ACXABG_05985 [Promethearchaeota archaeon]|jgi:hypothetical protein
MNYRKSLSILGGILTLVSTYFLAFYKSGFAYAYGFGAFIRVPLMFIDAPSYGLAFGIPFFLVYPIAVALLIFLLSGIFQIMAGTSRRLAIIGSLFGLGGAIFLFLLHSGIFPFEFTIYELMFIWDPFIDGIIPFHIEIATYSLGLYILLIGSILSLIGIILTRD